MCTLAILYKVARNTPVLLAANRERRTSPRPTQYPKIQPGTPRIVCGIDRQAGGTWLGVNQFGLVVAVTNRPKSISRKRVAFQRPALPRPRRPANRPDAVVCRQGAFRPGPMRGRITSRRREVRRCGLRRQPRSGRRTDPGAAHPDQRQPRRHAGRTARIHPPHVDPAHARFRGDISRRRQPGVFAEAGRRRPSRRGPQRRPVRDRFLDALSPVAEAAALDLSVRPRFAVRLRLDDLSALLRQVLSAARPQKAAGNGEKSRREKAKLKAKAKRSR